MPAGLSGQVDCKPESLAKSFLGQPSAISAERILTLFDALTRGCSNRSDEGASFGAGAFVRVGVGLRQSCKVYPNSIMAVNRFAQGVVDALRYTSFVILDNNWQRSAKILRMLISRMWLCRCQLSVAETLLSMLEGRK